MKRTIALITGGTSGELEISLKSARMVSKHIDPERYDVFMINLTADRWYGIIGDDQIEVDKNDFSLKVGETVYKFDSAFIAIHGTPGEDGKLQGYLDMLNIPYTSCNLFTSSLTFNKYFSNLAVASLGVDVARSCFLQLADKINVTEIVRTCGLPCFVKPNKGGSSVGVSKVKTIEELPDAIQKAFAFDDEVLVQQAISGREITCGLMKTGGRFLTFPLAEIVSKKEFFDYEAKYTDGMADEIIPAPVPGDMASKCVRLSEVLYEKLCCKGVVRFDYIMSGETFYFLEVNTIPGLSESSIVPRMAQAMGLSLGELFSTLIEEAVSWHKSRQYLNG